MTYATTELTTEEIEGVIAGAIRKAIADVAAEVGRRFIRSMLPELLSHVRDSAYERFDSQSCPTKQDRERLLFGFAHRYAVNALRSKHRRERERDRPKRRVSWLPQGREKLELREEVEGWRKFQKVVEAIIPDFTSSTLSDMERDALVKKALASLTLDERALFDLLARKPHPPIQDATRLLGVSASTVDRLRSEIRRKFKQAGFALHKEKRTRRPDSSKVTRVRPKVKSVETLPDGRKWYSAQGFFSGVENGPSNYQWKDPSNVKEKRVS